jgi:hypothetical protein
VQSPVHYFQEKTYVDQPAGQPTTVESSRAAAGNPEIAVTGASEPRHAGSLHPGELAHAAVMAALCVATAIVAAAAPSLRHLIIGDVECRR